MLGWAALSLPALCAGVPQFYGGLKVLRFLPAKIADYLHWYHADICPSLQVGLYIMLGQ